MAESTSDQTFQFCAEISKANGEEPIGSAGSANHWLFVEVMPPWPSDVWEANTIPPALLASVEQVRSSGANVKALGIQPDTKFSKAGHTRIIFYWRAKKQFSRYQKAEYVVPDSLAPNLITALFAKGDVLHSFAPYRQQTDPLREMFVCTHGSRDVCCGQTGYPLYEILRKMNPAQARMPIRAWRVSHNGGHKFAPTMLDFPYGHHWGHFEIPALLPLVEMSGSVETLLKFYRGWTGLDNKFLQMAERAVWQQEGWAWLDYEKSGEVINLDEEGQWAEIRLNYRSLDGAQSGAYTARIEASGPVQTLAKSGYGALEWVDQYRVTRLEHIEATESLIA